MNRENFPVSSNRHIQPEERERALDVLAAEVRRIQAQREENRRIQERLSTTQYLLQDNFPGSSSYLDNVPLQDLQLALSMSSTPTRPNPFGRQSFLPYGPSFLSASLPPNEAFGQLSTPSAAFGQFSTPSAASMPMQHLTERKRDSVLDPSDIITQNPRATASLRKYQEQTMYMPVSKKSRKRPRGSFPLPSLRERCCEEVKIPLTSYRNLWEENQRGDVFRKRIQCNQVPIEKDTSTTGRYSKKQRRI